MKVKGHRQSVVRWMLAGLAAALVIGGHARDASAVNVCNAALDSMFLSGPNFVVPSDATRDTVRLQLTLGAGTIVGAPTPPGPQLTLHRLRFDLDCSTGGLPCGDQGDVVSYGGDSTITTDCPGVSWTTNVPGGGSGTNEVVFTPSPAITITGGVTNFCHLAFDLIVVNPEPTSGPQSDATPLVIEEVVGFVQAAAFANGDATCNNNLQAGNQGSAAIPQCPVPCAGDECTDRVCPDDGPNAGTCVGTPKVSTSCTDTDGNVCTIAGCEASPTDLTSGVCVQTHMFATGSTPCSDTDGDACTTAGCDGSGVCDQNHMAKTCTVNECNLGCDKTTGQCSPVQPSTACTDSDSNECTLAGCEISATDPNLGVCVQTHMFASDSTPCADTDGNACTTAGCNGQGVCDQNHMVCAPTTGHMEVSGASLAGLAAKHAFKLSCVNGTPGQDLQIILPQIVDPFTGKTVLDVKFKTDITVPGAMTQNTCFNDPGIVPDDPTVGFNRIVGSTVGTMDKGVQGIYLAEYQFRDGGKVIGDPNGDAGFWKITVFSGPLAGTLIATSDPGGSLILLDKGNQKAKPNAS